VTLGEGPDAGSVYFGDAHANVYALDATSGKLLWKVRAETHPAAWISAAPRYYQGTLYQGISSSEEVLAASPLYDCCSFRGSIAAIDAASGKIRWQRFTVDKPPPPGASSGRPHGPSGAPIWATPTIDEQLHVLYAATGDNYSPPATATSDAVLALDLATGALLWSQQLTGQDAYNLGCLMPLKIHCPRPQGPDLDFGQPPILVHLAGTQRALVIAQKSGMAHALDPDRKGAILWQTRIGRGGSLGGSQWGSGTDGLNLYVAIADPAFHGIGLNLSPDSGGGLAALELGTGKILWRAPPIPCPRARPRCSPAQSAAVTVMDGAVFSGSLDGHLRAYSTRTGQVLWDFDTEQEFPTVNGKPARGGSLDAGGPAVVAGMVFAGSGYAQWGGAPGNVLLAFALDAP
jgi:polyvinyl alcohol dehydrogenase (cytochrome)